jgi:hypothetical protein
VTVISKKENSQLTPRIRPLVGSRHGLNYKDTKAFVSFVSFDIPGRGIKTSSDAQLKKERQRKL